MSDSDGSHICRRDSQELTPKDSEDPGSRRRRLATGDVNGFCVMQT